MARRSLCLIGIRMIRESLKRDAPARGYSFSKALLLRLRSHSSQSFTVMTFILSKEKNKIIGVPFIRY